MQQAILLTTQEWIPQPMNWKKQQTKFAKVAARAGWG